MQPISKIKYSLTSFITLMYDDVLVDEGDKYKKNDCSWCEIDFL